MYIIYILYIYIYIYYIFIFVMFKNARMPFKKIKKKETSIAVR